MIKKIMKYILVLCTLIGIFFSTTTVRAESGNLALRETGEISKVALKDPNGVVYRWTLRNYLTINDMIAFCLDFRTLVEVGAYDGTEFTDIENTGGQRGDIFVNRDLQRKIMLVDYFGYKINPNGKNYHYTNLLIWEELGAEIQSLDQTLSMAEYHTFKTNVLAKVNSYKDNPVWTNKEITLKVGESVTLIDDNNVVQNLTIPASQNGYQFTVNGNTLTVTATAQATDSQLDFRQPFENGVHGTPLVWKRPGAQTVGTLRIADPQSGKLNLTVIPNGSLKIIKTDRSSGKAIEGVEFTLYNAATNEVIKTVKTDKNGVAQVIDLDPAQTFYFKETQSKNGYMLNNKRYDVTIKHGETTTVNVANEPVPTIHTKATAKSGGKESYAYETHQEIAKMDKLVVGTTYSVVATQYSSKGEVLATQEREFVAKGKEHTETFEFDVPVKYVGDIVYGEDLYRDKEKVAVHFDLENKEQTIKVLEPKINTLAQIGGAKEQFVGEKKALVDTLTYSNFKNGKVLVKTWVVKYGTDEIVGEPVEQALELDGNGEVSVKLDKIDTSTLPVGKYTIMEQVFEVIEKDDTVEKGNLISEHVDNKDANQSFTVKVKPIVTSPQLPKTGTASFIALVGLGVAFIVGALAIFRKAKKG